MSGMRKLEKEKESKGVRKGEGREVWKENTQRSG